MSKPLLAHSTILDGRWSLEDVDRLYGLSDWGKGYFGVNPAGHLMVMPSFDPARSIDLYELIEGLRERGIHTPVLVRFTDVVAQRLKKLRSAFDAAIAENEYQGRYMCVYPIKVNQQRHVCEEIRDFGAELGFGLEAGSKPELLAVLGMTVEHNSMPIVCNGFKDREFIEAVILATKLGRNIIPVVERFGDLELIVELSERYQVRPQIGLRVKPSTRGSGKWQSSAGLRSKFGLTGGETLRALELLRSHRMEDCLKMLHFHMGSQLSDIRKLKGAVTEVAHFYTELRRLGARGLTMIDVGGGLGVDYDGSQSAYESSVNYTITEYASDVVYRIGSACDEAGQPHPTIISESGRAMVAFSSALIFDVLGRATFDGPADIAEIGRQVEAEEEPPQCVLDLLDAHSRVSDRNWVEVFHDAVEARDEANSLFSLGYISLPMKSASESLFWAVGQQVLERARRQGEMPDDILDLNQLLADMYYCNFSVFQSLPDSWAIGQLFPVMPIHRLDERPTRLATLADITCDSDGKLDRFVDPRDIKSTLELHDLRPGEPYYIGAFLIGAYQEILGDLHNLFGDTHAVHVSLDEEGRLAIEEVVKGDTVREVLGYVEFNSDELVRILRRDVERAVRLGDLEVSEGRALVTFYERGLDGYTYLE